MSVVSNDSSPSGKINLDRWVEERIEESTSSNDRENRLVDAALELAKVLQRRAAQLQTPEEKRQQAELDRMIQMPEDKATLTQMTDQGFRSSSPGRAVDQMTHILDVQGVPRFFNPFDRTLLRGFQSFGGYLPGVAVPMVKEKMRKETANVILPAEEATLTRHLRERRNEGLRMNVNFLGEAILGEEEAQRRLESYLQALQLDETECMSIKISCLYSQISPIDRKNTLSVLSDRLELLYRAAAKERFVRHDGTEVSKFIYLDMEEYRDLHLTAELFMKTLERGGMQNVRAGIALQAYVPDSFGVQKQLTEWAQRRVAAGGSPITIRIVKGANMEMERVEASVRGWPQAPYKCKVETDANYKRMLQYGMESNNLDAVRLGIASHNLFDLAYSLVSVAACNATEHVQFEMLEGMANHQRRAVFELTGNVLLYAPSCRKEDFINAIGYLVRRLDENTGPDNFLRHAFNISVGNKTWNRLESSFLQSLGMLDSVSDAPRRTQDRRQPPTQPPAPTSWQTFVNEPDTDFSLPVHCEWAESIRDSWITRCNDQATEIPLWIGHTHYDVDQAHSGEASGTTGGSIVESLDPSRPDTVSARFVSADAQQISSAVDIAVTGQATWSSMSTEERYQILRDVAQRIRIRRADLIGAAMADAGKTFWESDPEISEAIDFVEFYARTALDLFNDSHINTSPAGPVAVVSPWNFPIAIPCGGIAAALATGNSAILKPASDTVLPAYILCQCFWDAGVPRDVLQLVPCSGSLAGKHLIGRPEFSAVVLTGGTETALRMKADYPSLNLLAETGGKNVTIVSSLSDRDMAIKDVLHSAFAHAGQKCSATSILLLEKEVFEDHEFREQLIDAVESLKVGSAWNLGSKVGPLIRPPEGDLLRGLKDLEHSESWAVMPHMLDDNPCLYSPGVKYGTRPGSFTHMTELFGPVLGVMKYEKLNEAIDLVNSTGFGLTSGLESLDDREQAIWKSRIRAGNLYINRPTTGAIVLRQPFGGMGKSAFGPGIKAGGPNYVAQFLKFENPTDVHLPSLAKPELPQLEHLWDQLHRPTGRGKFLATDGSTTACLKQLLKAISSYDKFAREEIRQEHDHFDLIGQDNIRRYLPMTHVRIRTIGTDQPWAILAAASAAVAAGSRVTLSYPRGEMRETIACIESLTETWAADIEFVEEDDAELCRAIIGGQAERLRFLDTAVPLAVEKAATEVHIHIAHLPISSFGRIEVLWYVEEQSLSFDYHRYGNLGPRIEESRTECL
jgi:RHH-type proline utilization regulon transcriptional repressor/proline dehydrogenase/delta 1-pyrroline-5-carboxylate dehydrogenase